MHRQFVMNHSGHDEHAFDPTNKVDVDKAKERFDQITDAGYTAATRNDDGSATVVRQFDPNAKETLFIPRLVGG